MGNNNTHNFKKGLSIWYTSNLAPLMRITFQVILFIVAAELIIAVAVETMYLIGLLTGEFIGYIPHTETAKPNFTPGWTERLPLLFLKAENYDIIANVVITGIVSSVSVAAVTAGPYYFYKYICKIGAKVGDIQ